MLDPGNIDRDSLSPILEKMGRDEAGTRFNVFRRFREAVLQRSEARQILIDYWMGHSNPSMADRYGRQLVEDVEYRQEQVKKVGLGFDLPPSLIGLRGLQAVVNMSTKKPPKCYNEQRVKSIRACSSAGRAPALQAGGCGFESRHVHQLFHFE